MFFFAGRNHIIGNQVFWDFEVNKIGDVLLQQLQVTVFGGKILGEKITSYSLTEGEIMMQHRIVSDTPSLPTEKHDLQQQQDVDTLNSVTDRYL